MRIAVTGSIATDHLMTFPGRFADSLVVDQLDKISLSFLVDELEIRRGGVAANIAFGMGEPRPAPAPGRRRGRGLRRLPLLAGAPRRRHRVGARLASSRHTARFVCTTDDDQAQIATFYAGAMSEARDIELGPIAERVGGLDLVLIGANDPEAMLRHTEECRTRGHPVRRRPVPAARVRRRRRDPPARRRRGLPVHQRVRGRADRAEDRLVRATRSSTGSASGSPRWAARACRIEPQGRGRRSRCRWPGRSARPTRPASATPSGPASSPASPGAWTYGAAPRSARCSRPTSSRRSGTQEYAARPGALPRAARRRLRRRLRPTRSARTCVACRARLSRPCPSRCPPPSRCVFDVDRGATPGEDLVGVGADLAPGTLLAAYRAGLFPMGLGAAGASADRLVVAGPARDPAPAGPARQPVAAPVAAALRGRASTPPSREVVAGCADPSRSGRWITPEIVEAYTELHALGWAHSVEVLAGRPAGRRALRGRDRRPVRRRVDVPHGDRRLEGRPSSALVDIAGRRRRPATLVDVQWRTPHLATLGVTRGAAVRVPAAAGRCPDRPAARALPLTSPHVRTFRRTFRTSGAKGPHVRSQLRTRYAV